MAAGSSCARAYRSQGLVSAHCNEAIYPSVGGKAIGAERMKKERFWRGKKTRNGQTGKKNVFPVGVEPTIVVKHKVTT